MTLIAPANNSHPSDYEPKPSDLTAITGADYVVLAEYDGFAEQLRDATGSSAKVIGLTPENSPAKVRADVLALGKTFKTPERAQAWITTFDAEYQQLSDATKAVAAGKTAVAHMFMAPWATFSGTKLVGTYGPGPIKPSQLLKLKRKKANLLFENVHLPFGGGLAGNDTEKASLINYPRSLDLLTVFRANAASIQAAAKRARRASPTRTDAVATGCLRSVASAMGLRGRCVSGEPRSPTGPWTMRKATNNHAEHVNDNGKPLADTATVNVP